MLAFAQHALRQGDVIFNIFGCQDGRPGRHTAHERDVDHLRAVHLVIHGNGDGPRLHGIPIKQALLLKPDQMAMHRGGAFEPCGITNLAHRGRIAFLERRLFNISKDPGLRIAARIAHGFTSLCFSLL